MQRSLSTEALAFDMYGTLVDPLRIWQQLERTLGDAAPRAAELWRAKQLEYTFRLTAMQRYSGYVITLLPIGLAILLFIISPSYISVMLENPPEMFGLPMGVVFFIVGLISMGIGFLLIRRIVDIKV